MSEIIVIALNALSTRTRWIAKATKAKLYTIKSKPPYMTLEYKLLRILEKEKPRKVIAQLPTGPLLAALIAIKRIKRDIKIIADVHTGFLTAKINATKHGLLNAPFKPLLAHTDLLLIHNKYNEFLLSPKLKEKIFILYDPFYVFREESVKIINEMNASKKSEERKIEQIINENYVVYPASWHPDEPVYWIIKTWIKEKIEPKLVITGKPPV